MGLRSGLQRKLVESSQLLHRANYYAEGAHCSGCITLRKDVQLIHEKFSRLTCDDRPL
jgi:hypothetical protein